MKAKTFKLIFNNHEKYWDDQAEELYAYKQAYNSDFWADNKTWESYTENSEGQNSKINVQTSMAFDYIEGFQASLFSKNPAIELVEGVRGLGTKSIAQDIANNYLLKTRNQIERASRLALLYPCSFLKLIPIESEDIYSKVTTVAIPPWEIVIDTDAVTWDAQRFVAHVYWMSLYDAKKKFGNKDYDAERKKMYFSPKNQNEEEDIEEEDIFNYIKVCELYDFMDNKMKFWSPNYKQGTAFLDETVIPFSNIDGKLFAPISPWYYCYLTDTPLIGYSAMKRKYDQIFEVNNIRSYQACAVRKNARMWLYKKDRIGPEQQAQIVSGEEGLLVPIELELNESLSDVIVPIPNNTISADIDRYYEDVKRDFNMGSALAPFTRGEATSPSSTATEIAAMAAYTSTEIGMLARERDAAIEYLSFLYLNILSNYIRDDGNKKALIKINGEIKVVKSTDLQGDFEYFASDSASTPLSEMYKKQELMANIPTLVQLGIPVSNIREEVIRRLKLPQTWNDEAEKKERAVEEQAKAQAEQARVQAGAATEPPPSTQDIIANPSMNNLANVLPGGNV